MPYQTALVIGGGAFGTSMASLLAANFKQVYIFDQRQEIAEAINRGENEQYFPGKKLPANLKAIMPGQLHQIQSFKKLELVILALPAAAVEGFLVGAQDLLRPLLDAHIPFCSLTKGIDPKTLQLVDDIYAKYFPHQMEDIMFLSGPSFAQEIVEKQITIVSLAGRSRQLLMKGREMLRTNYFKVVPTYDVKGTLLGGALKNVIAIGGGIVEGLGFNHNTRAALIWRGITEMLRFGRVFNARPETFYGPSGMGDLILTTTGELSRNKLFGLRIARGERPEDILKDGILVEGHQTALAAHRIAEKFSIRAAVFEGVYQVLFEGLKPQEVIAQMMENSPSSEIDSGR